MSIQEAQSRIKARVWQSIAQANLNVSGLDKQTLESLVELVTEAALLEFDDQLEAELGQKGNDTAVTPDDNDDTEKMLWAGRPLLSISTHYTITSERIKIRHGLLGKAYDYVELVRIQDMKHRQSFSERILTVGDVIIRSHDPSHPTIELNNVKNPEHVYEILRDAVQNARKRHNFSYREEM
jgi:hypothetical protein